MADVIGAQLLKKSQEIYADVLALGVVLDLYMDSSGKKIDDMIFIVDHLYSPLVDKAEDLQRLLREAVK